VYGTLTNELFHALAIKLSVAHKGYSPDLLLPVQSAFCTRLWVHRVISRDSFDWIVLQSLCIQTNSFHFVCKRWPI